MKDLQALAQSELQNLIDYFHINNLVPNPTKTNYTVFYPTKDQEDIQLKINTTTLEQNTKSKTTRNYHAKQTQTSTKQSPI